MGARVGARIAVLLLRTNLSRVTLQLTTRIDAIPHGHHRARKCVDLRTTTQMLGRTLVFLSTSLLATSVYSQVSAENPSQRVMDAQSSSIQHALAQARSAGLERRYSDAIKLLRSALAENPGQVELQLELGRSYLAIGRDSRAEGLFRDILKKDPQNRDAQLELARSIGYQGHYRESDELYRHLLGINPADEAAAIGLAGNLLHQGRTAEAASVASAALPFHPNSLRLMEYRDRIAGRLLGADERSLPTPGNLFSADTEFITDSAGNHSWRGIQRLELKVRPALTSDSRIEEQFLHSLDNPLDVVQTFSETVRWKPWERLGLTFGGGGVRFDNGDVSPIYETTLTTQLANRLLVGGGFSRVPVTPDAEAAEYRITAQGWEVYGLWVPNGWEINARASRRHYTDGNIGGMEGVEAARQWTTSKFNYLAGYRFRHYSFDENLAHGYFSPDNYQSHQGKVGVVFHPNRRYRGELIALVGAESIASGAPFAAAWEITTRHHLTFGPWELGLDYSRYHMAQVTGAFRADAGRFELAYHF